LDSEVVGTDPTTLTPLTREFVIPVESISGQSSLELIVVLLSKILVEIKALRLLTEAGASPEAVDEMEELFTSEEPETELEES
jgi:hypothetical protein